MSEILSWIRNKPFGLWPIILAGFVWGSFTQWDWIQRHCSQYPLSIHPCQENLLRIIIGPVAFILLFFLLFLLFSWLALHVQKSYAINKANDWFCDKISKSFCILALLVLWPLFDYSRMTAMLIFFLFLFCLWLLIYIGEPKKDRSIDIFILLLFSWIVLITAWLTDDSFISLRQVWNAIHGYGYTWNFNQRVQAFTHPTWTVLLTIFSFITREIYHTTIFVSILSSLASIWLIIKHNSLLPKNLKYDNYVMGFCLICLSFSKAYTDYMTSGLENPLSYLLLGLFIYYAVKSENTGKNDASVKYLFIVLALLFLNRFDYAVLILPLALYLIYRNGWFHSIRMSLLGIGLIFAWFTFATIYFGTPLPNTFYAKLTAGYPPEEYYQRGMNYYVLTFTRDPITLVLIFLGIFTGLLTKKGLYKALSIGMILYCLYIIKIGGDFMLGRFFSVLAYASIFNICAFISHSVYITRNFRMRFVLVLVLIVSLVFGTVPAFSSLQYQHRQNVMGIADERGFYFEHYGLLSPARSWPKKKLPVPETPKTYKVICGGLGMTGFELPDVYLVDTCALANAFLSRLPAIQDPNWIIGHAHRKVPTNYGLYLVKQKKLKDKKLQPMLNDVTAMVSGELFSLDRWKAIIRLNISKPYQYDTEIYKDPKINIPLTSGLQSKL